MKRYKCTCAYDGTSLNGWQSQSSGNGIQDIIENTLSKLLSQKTRIHASGRTDAGVHASGQVFHFDAHWNHPPDALTKALNALLPKQILILKTSITPTSFHARFSAKKKRYIYLLSLKQTLPTQRLYIHSLKPYNYNIPLMQQAASLFLGKHNFSHFTVNKKSTNPNDLTRTIYKSLLSINNHTLKFTTEGDGFLYKMVRKMTGALINIGSGKLSLQQLSLLLNNQPSNIKIPSAPPHGLSLNKVWY